MATTGPQPDRTTSSSAALPSPWERYLLARNGVKQFRFFSAASGTSTWLPQGERTTPAVHTSLRSVLSQASSPVSRGPERRSSRPWRVTCCRQKRGQCRIGLNCQERTRPLAPAPGFSSHAGTLRSSHNRGGTKTQSREKEEGGWGLVPFPTL